MSDDQQLLFRGPTCGERRAQPRSACRTKVALIVPYFGPFPPWIDDFIETCKYNPTIDWLLFSDSKPPANSAANVKLRPMTLSDFADRVNSRLELTCSIHSGYKICDFRPAFGVLFEDELRGYVFWGHCDLDVVWGRVRKFLSEAVLAAYDVVSGDADRLCGPLTIFRNCSFINSLFRRGPYRDVFCDRSHRCFDESGFDQVVKAAANGELRLRLEKLQEWDSFDRDRLIDRGCSWRRGRLFDAVSGRELMFYHFNGSKRWPWPTTWRPA